MKTGAKGRSKQAKSEKNKHGININEETVKIELITEELKGNG